MEEISHIDNIKEKIHTIKGKQVILDSDIAKLYNVETKTLNQSVKRNKDRFPERYMFRLTRNEFDFLRSQFVTANISFSKKRFLPYAFTEQGVAMLSSILKSKEAIRMNLLIIDAFVLMKKFISENSQFFQKFQQIDQKLLEHDNKLGELFKALETETPKQGIFYNGQVFDVLF